MPWNGNGVFLRLYSWVSDKNAGIDINSSRMDADTNDIVTGLDNTVTLDGQTIPVHSLPMGGFTHTGVGNATARTNYAAAGQVVDGSLLWGGTSGGTANAQTIAITPVVTALVAGQSFRFIAGITNTSAATLTVNATTPTAIRKIGISGPAVLTGNEIIIGNSYTVGYDGTYFILFAAGVSVLWSTAQGGTGRTGVPSLLVLSSAAQTFTANQTVFVGVGSGGTSEGGFIIPLPVPGTIKNMSLRSTADPGVGQTYTATMRKLSADTTLTCQITSGNSMANDGTHSFTVAANDYVCLKVVLSVTAATSAFTVACEYDIAP